MANKELTPIFRRARDTGVVGLTLLEGFITEAEEDQMLKFVDSNSDQWEGMAKRRVQHYGFAFDYKLRGVNPRRKIGPLPDAFQPLVSRLSKLSEINRELDQLTVNEYVPGVGLSPHVDTHSMFTGSIASVTLSGHTVMEFRRGEERRAILLPRRSVLILAEDARYAWRHYIPHRKFDLLGDERLGSDQKISSTPRPPRRVSLTFRSIRGFPCECRFPEECDTRREEEVLKTPEVEEVYVKQMYDAIAPHFSSTRFSQWPKIVEFLHTVDKGSVIVDAGCGNGKYLDVRRDCVMLGSDVSVGLARQCTEKGFDVVVGDVMGLPYRDSCCDAAICIAVVHHMSTEARRQRVVAELARVLRRGGRGLVTAWAMEQENPSKTLNKWEKIEEEDFFVPWHLPSHRTRAEHQQDQNAQLKKTEQDEFRVYKRYYHMFREGELDALVNSVAGARTIHSFFDKSNWCVIFEATAG